MGGESKVVPVGERPKERMEDQCRIKAGWGGESMVVRVKKAVTSEVHVAREGAVNSTGRWGRPETNPNKRSR